MSTDPSLPSVQEGLVVAGRYRLIERIGSGAMGSVWRGEHVSLGNAVALKFLHAAVAEDRDSRARFDREAKLAARLGELSRHITRVTDHGLLDDGTPYLVMEMLRGEGLDRRVKREKQLAPLVALDIVQQLCKALQVAHDQGVVHRDLKPANVFLQPDDDGVFVKLLDFGVAKARLANDAHMTTQSGSLIGTPAYMSPEQFDGVANVDRRADLWAVTAMVYRMLLGCEPFSASGLAELAVRVVVATPTPPSQLDPRLPPELDAFVARGLAKKPEERFQSARELAVALDGALRARQVYQEAPADPAPMPLDVTVPPHMRTLDESTSSASTVVRPSGGRRTAFLVAGTLLAAGLFGGGLYLRSAQEQGRGSAPAATEPRTQQKDDDDPPKKAERTPVKPVAKTDEATAASASAAPSAVPGTATTPAASAPVGALTTKPTTATKPSTPPAVGTAVGTAVKPSTSIAPAKPPEDKWKDDTTL